MVGLGPPGGYLPSWGSSLRSKNYYKSRCTTVQKSDCYTTVREIDKIITSPGVLPFRNRNVILPFEKLIKLLQVPVYYRSEIGMLYYRSTER
jgi:hypothetical protein